MILNEKKAAVLQIVFAEMKLPEAARYIQEHAIATPPPKRSSKPKTQVVAGPKPEQRQHDVKFTPKEKQAPPKVEKSKDVRQPMEMLETPPLKFRAMTFFRFKPDMKLEGASQAFNVKKDILSYSSPGQIVVLDMGNVAAYSPNQVNILMQLSAALDKSDRMLILMNVSQPLLQRSQARDVWGKLCIRANLDAIERDLDSGRYDKFLFKPRPIPSKN